jgi:hypothetical protein
LGCRGLLNPNNVGTIQQANRDRYSDAFGTGVIKEISPPPLRVKKPHVRTSEKKTRDYNSVCKKAEAMGLRFLTPLEEYVGTGHKGKFQCINEGHEAWEAVINSVIHNNRYMCKQCKGPYKCEAMSIYIISKLLEVEFVKTRSILSNNYELDGYNEKLKVAIEYMGSQHYKFSKLFHNTQEVFEQQKIRDAKKVDECKILGIKLIIIHYTFTSAKNIGLEIIRQLKDYGFEINENIDWENISKEFYKKYPTLSDENNMRYLEQIQALAISKGGQCLETTYDDNKTKMRFICVNGHEFKSTKDQLLAKNNPNWCSKCTPVRELTDEICQEYAQKCGTTFVSREKTAAENQRPPKDGSVREKIKKYEYITVRCNQDGHVDKYKTSAFTINIELNNKKRVNGEELLPLCRQCKKENPVKRVIKKKG